MHVMILQFIDVSPPVKHPDLSGNQMVRRSERWYRRWNGTYLPRHYYKNKKPILGVSRIFQSAESRIKLTEQ